MKTESRNTILAVAIGAGASLLGVFASVVFGQQTSDVIPLDQRVSPELLVTVFSSSLMLAVILARIIESLLGRLLPRKADVGIERLRAMSNKHHEALVALLYELKIRNETLLAEQARAVARGDDARAALAERMKDIAQINTTQLEVLLKISAVLDTVARPAQ